MTDSRTYVSLALVLLFNAGCARSERTASDGKSTRLLALASLHAMMQSATGSAPANEQQFKDFVTEKGNETLKQMGVSNVYEMFVSERDGQPFVVVYGKRPPGMATSVVAYERQGMDGERLVGHSTRMIEKADETRFREIVPAGAP